MPHVICPSCHVQYNATASRCPNCGVRRPQAWRPLVDWRWPVPLACGLVLEAAAMRFGPSSLHPVAQSPVVSGSWFIAGALLFALVVHLVLLVIGGVVRTLRRRMQRSSRRKLARKRM